MPDVMDCRQRPSGGVKCVSLPYRFYENCQDKRCGRCFGLDILGGAFQYPPKGEGVPTRAGRNRILTTEQYTKNPLSRERGG